MLANQATRPTILVVDDDTAILELVASLLEEEFDVVCARDAWEAVAVAAERRPDVILLDLMMPGINGLSLARELRKLPRARDVPVFVMTAHGGLRDEIERLGVTGLFLKPFEPDLLVAEIEASVER